MPMLRLCLLFWAMFSTLLPAPAAAQGGPAEAMRSVVSVLPVWPGHAQGGTGVPPGTAPEGSGVVLKPNLVATAWHVIEPASRIEVRLDDGRVLPAELIARDPASDIALLRVAVDLEPFVIAPQPLLAQPVCAIGNAYGLDLSVTCGVVSALNVSNAGFNAVEDFVQTDAAANPGSSGGALVDDKGRLLGMISAIFASDADTNIGVNFAVSTDLLLRVTDALLASGEVEYPKPGWRLIPPDREQLQHLAAPVVSEVSPAGPAQQAGILPGDLIVSIGTRRIQSPRAALAALAILPEDQSAVDIMLERAGSRHVVALLLKAPSVTVSEKSDAPKLDADCPHPVPVCQMRQAVFPISGFDPLGSATRIAQNLLVTNRHVVGDYTEVQVYTPSGPKSARVIASAYQGDLALLEVEGLPEVGTVPTLSQDDVQSDVFYAIGADVARQVVRVFDPGDFIAGPADGARLGRLHVHARMQPGVSGGALVDEAGRLLAIAVGGGEGRYEAIPVAQVRRLLDLRSDDAATAFTQRLGVGLVACSEAMDAVPGGDRNDEQLRSLIEVCSAAMNAGQLLEAGRLLAQHGNVDGAIALHTQAVNQVPNSINARISLLVSLQLATEFQEMTGHARWLAEMAPDDPRALRFAIQSGVWGDDPELAEEGYQALLKADPQQAQAARRFIDAAPPAPQRQQ